MTNSGNKEKNLYEILRGKGYDRIYFRHGRMRLEDIEEMRASSIKGGNVLFEVDEEGYFLVMAMRRESPAFFIGHRNLTAIKRLSVIEPEQYQTKNGKLYLYKLLTEQQQDAAYKKYFDGLLQK